MAGKRIRMICPKCGSAEVLRDAYASWDEDAQAWALSATFDDFTCGGCGSQWIKPEEEEIADEPVPVEVV